MSQMFSVKDFCKTKAASNEYYCKPNQGATQPDIDETADDFGKILDQQEVPSNTHERILKTDKKVETQENSNENQEACDQENSLLKKVANEFSSEITLPMFEGKKQMVEDNRWIQESNVVLELQNQETFSKDVPNIAENDVGQESMIDRGQNIGTSVSIPKFGANVPDTKKIVEGSPNVGTDNVNLLVVKKEPINTIIPNETVEEEISLVDEAELKNTKMETKVSKNFPFVPQNDARLFKVVTTLISGSPETFQSKSNLDNFLDFQRFEAWNNSGIKSAPRGNERKGGFMSPHSNILKTSEFLSPKDAFKTSGGSMFAEALSQNADKPFLKKIEQSSETREDILTSMQPKSAVNLYETIQQNHREEVQGVIAILEQKIDELKRSRRNSATVKIDLENGESLNCHVTLSRSDVFVRFSALAEDFKAQILKHWEFLRNFAQIRRLNLSDPNFNIL